MKLTELQSILGDEINKVRKSEGDEKVVKGAKPSLIDRLMPYILIMGFLGFCLLVGGLAEWVIDLTAGVR